MGQWATPVPVAANRATASSDRCTQSAATRPGPAIPGPRRTGGGAAERVQAELLLVLRLGHMGVQPDAGGAGQRGAVPHQLPGHRERRAGGDRDAGHRVRGRVVPAVDRGLRGGQDRVVVLDHRVGRQPAGRLPQVHRAARRVETDPDLPGGQDLRFEQVTRARREHVEMVGARGGAGQGQPGQAGRGGRAEQLRGQPGPDRIQGLQPAEQGVVGGIPAGDPLIEVGVGVDQAGRDQPPGAVDPGGRGELRRTGPGPAAAIRPWSMTTWPEGYSLPAGSTVAT